MRISKITCGNSLTIDFDNGYILDIGNDNRWEEANAFSFSAFGDQPIMAIAFWWDGSIGLSSDISSYKGNSTGWVKH